MRIEQVTKYRCDGCESEHPYPAGWVSVVPMQVGTVTMTIGGKINTEDYCSECIKKMRDALSRPLREDGGAP